MIFGREPAVWIGLVITLISGAVATLLGYGLISDIQANRVNDLLEAAAQLALALAPLITGLLIRQTVTPVAAPQLPVGTQVETPNGGSAVVAPTGAVPQA